MVIDLVKAFAGLLLPARPIFAFLFRPSGHVDEKREHLNEFVGGMTRRYKPSQRRRGVKVERGSRAGGRRKEMKGSVDGQG